MREAVLILDLEDRGLPLRQEEVVSLQRQEAQRLFGGSEAIDMGRILGHVSAVSLHGCGKAVAALRSFQSVRQLLVVILGRSDDSDMGAIVLPEELFSMGVPVLWVPDDDGVMLTSGQAVSAFPPVVGGSRSRDLLEVLGVAPVYDQVVKALPVMPGRAAAVALEQVAIGEWGLDIAAGEQRAIEMLVGLEGTNHIVPPRADVASALSAVLPRPSSAVHIDPDGRYASELADLEDAAAEVGTFSERLEGVPPWAIDMAEAEQLVRRVQSSELQLRDTLSEIVDGVDSMDGLDGAELALLSAMGVHVHPNAGGEDVVAVLTGLWRQVDEMLAGGRTIDYVCRQLQEVRASSTPDQQSAIRDRLVDRPSLVRASASLPRVEIGGLGALGLAFCASVAMSISSPTRVTGAGLVTAGMLAAGTLSRLLRGLSRDHVFALPRHLVGVGPPLVMVFAGAVLGLALSVRVDAHGAWAWGSWLVGLSLAVGSLAAAWSRWRKRFSNRFRPETMVGMVNELRNTITETIGSQWAQASQLKRVRDFSDHLEGTLHTMSRVLMEALEETDHDLSDSGSSLGAELSEDEKSVLLAPFASSLGRLVPQPQDALLPSPPSAEVAPPSPQVTAAMLMAVSADFRVLLRGTLKAEVVGFMMDSPASLEGATYERARAAFSRALSAYRSGLRRHGILSASARFGAGGRSELARTLWEEHLDEIRRLVQMKTEDPMTYLIGPADVRFLHQTPESMKSLILVPPDAEDLVSRDPGRTSWIVGGNRAVVHMRLHGLVPGAVELLPTSGGEGRGPKPVGRKKGGAL